MVDPIVAAMEEVAGPHLYRRNAFRITGLRTDADRPAVRLRRQKVRTLLKVGGDAGIDADPQEADAAFDLILGDPRRRLVHELFWLWDQPGATCTCGPALHRAHDDAVRAHSEAIDAERKMDWPSPLERRRVDELWTKAGNVWSQQARRAAFWNHVRERIAALDDRQLGESAVDVLRDELAVTLVRPLVQLTAAGGKRQAELSRLAHAWPGTSSFVDGQLEKTAEPLYEQLRADLRRSTERLNGSATPQQVAKQLRLGAVPKLELLEGLVPADRHRPTARLRNDVATAFNNCATKLIEKAGPDADKSAGEWLKRARELATESQTTITIDKNIATLAEIVRAGRPGALPLTGDPLIDRALARMNQTPGGQAFVDDVLEKYGLREHYLPIYDPPPRRLVTFLRKLLKLALWALILYGLFWFFFHWLPSLGSHHSAESKVSVAAESMSGNAPAGTCIADIRDWVANARALPSVACDKKHEGEVLGYVPLAGPSQFPGDELLGQRSVYQCSFLQAGLGLATGEYIADSIYTNQDAWNAGDHYASCLLHRIDGKAMPTHAVVDPNRTPVPEPTVDLTMMSLDLTANPPPGSCIATRSSFEKNDARADFVDCGAPHWGEIIGYPVLYQAGGEWPGDKDVFAAADPACRSLFEKRGLDKGYAYVTSWPGQAFWTEAPEQRKYAVCIVKRAGDEPTSRALP